MFKDFMKSNESWWNKLLLGGLGAIGALSPISDIDKGSYNPSPTIQSWISDIRRKERSGYVIAALSQPRSELIQPAAHRSHRSHASHYSSTGGHRSHYSHYSGYSSPSDSTNNNTSSNNNTSNNENTQTRKAVPNNSNQTTKRVQVPILPKATEPNKAIEPNNSKIMAEAPEIKRPEKSKLSSSVGINPEILSQAIPGKVKSIVSPTVFILEDAKIVELLGVKCNKLSSLQEDATAQGMARAALTRWINNKPVLINYQDGNKAYVYVFNNELECSCVNLEMVKEGRLGVDSNSSIYAQDLLLNAQKKAQENKYGIWKDMK